LLIFTQRATQNIIVFYTRSFTTLSSATRWMDAKGRTAALPVSWTLTSIRCSQQVDFPKKQKHNLHRPRVVMTTSSLHSLTHWYGSCC
jgi:hypothetical protein